MVPKDLADRIKDGDRLYVYILNHFTGFAPCFEGGHYSLACCMGNRKTGGMRASACSISKELKETGNHIWILGTAGRSLDRSLQYDYRDMIYLAMVDPDEVYSWADYVENHSDRRDAIYLSRETYMEKYPERSEPDKNYKMICIKDQDHSQNNEATDCATDNKDYLTMEQIVFSDRFMIFDPKQPLLDGLSAYRGGKMKDNDPVLLREYIKQNPDRGFCSDPFSKKNKHKKGACGK